MKMKKPHKKSLAEMDMLARQLAWPGIARNAEEIDKVLSTLPQKQAIELKRWIERARKEFEQDFETRHAELDEMARERAGAKETERLCKVIAFPFDASFGENVVEFPKRRKFPGNDFPGDAA